MAIDRAGDVGYIGAMTPAQLRRIRKVLRLTQAELAAQLGVERVTVTRWELGERRISEPIARLLQRIAAEARGKATAERKGRGR